MFEEILVNLASEFCLGVMGTRFYHSGHFMPAGLVCVVSALMVCRYAGRSFGITNK